MLARGLCIFFCAGTYHSQAMAQGKLSEVYQVMVQKIDEKSLLSPEQEFVIEAGQFVGVSQIAYDFENFELSDRVLSFDRAVNSQQTNYRLDANGEKILPGEFKTIRGVSHCQFSERMSASRILGICFNPLTGSSEAGELDLLADGSLKMTMQGATAFDDGYSALGWKPMRWVSSYHFHFDQELTSFDLVQLGFNFDPVSNLAETQPYARITRSFYER